MAEFTIISKSADGEYSRNMTVEAETKEDARKIAQDYNLAVADQEQVQPYEIVDVT